MNQHPLVIFVFDGLDQSIADRCHMPSLQALRERGQSGAVSGASLISEHGNWVSVLTGLSKARHGYYCYRQLEPGTYNLNTHNIADVSCKPFWSRSSDLKVALFDPPETRLDAELQGVQLFGWSQHMSSLERVAPCSIPQSLLDEIDSTFGKPEQFIEFEQGSSEATDKRILDGMLKRICQKGEMIRAQSGRQAFDLIVAGFYEAHTGAHRFWKYRNSNSQLHDAIEKIYGAIDEQLGLLVDSLPAQSNVIVLSAFGMKDQYPTKGLIESFCQTLGYQNSPLPAKQASLDLNPLSLARALIPQTLREQISQFLPAQVQERLLRSGFIESTDWHRTRAFPIPSLYCSFLRVNLKSREPQGIVDESEYSQLLDRLEADLRSLKDPADNSAAVEFTVRTVDAFDCDLNHGLPDLFVEWQPSKRFIERLDCADKALKQMKQSYNRDSWHSNRGLYVAAGPDIQTLPGFGEVDVLHLAPTFLTLLKQSVPGDLETASSGMLLQSSNRAV